jgi:hypothetical protein
MKAVAKALYTEPILFLAVVQVVLSTLAATGKISGWIPVVSLAVVTVVQRNFATPAKSGRRAG